MLKPPRPPWSRRTIALNENLSASLQELKWNTIEMEEVYIKRNRPTEGARRFQVVERYSSDPKRSCSHQQDSSKKARFRNWHHDRIIRVSGERNKLARPDISFGDQHEGRLHTLHTQAPDESEVHVGKLVGVEKNSVAVTSEGFHLLTNRRHGSLVTCSLEHGLNRGAFVTFDLNQQKTHFQLLCFLKAR